MAQAGLSGCQWPLYGTWSGYSQPVQLIRRRPADGTPPRRCRATGTPVRVMRSRLQTDRQPSSWRKNAGCSTKPLPAPAGPGEPPPDQPEAQIEHALRQQSRNATCRQASSSIATASCRWVRRSRRQARNAPRQTWLTLSKGGCRAMPDRATASRKPAMSSASRTFGTRPCQEPTNPASCIVRRAARQAWRLRPCRARAAASCCQQRGCRSDIDRIGAKPIALADDLQLRAAGPAAMPAGSRRRDDRRADAPRARSDSCSDQRPRFRLQRRHHVRRRHDARPGTPGSASLIRVSNTACACRPSMRRVVSRIADGIAFAVRCRPEPASWFFAMGMWAAVWLGYCGAGCARRSARRADAGWRGFRACAARRWHPVARRPCGPEACGPASCEVPPCRLAAHCIVLVVRPRSAAPARAAPVAVRFSTNPVAPDATRLAMPDANRTGACTCRTQ